MEPIISRAALEAKEREIRSAVRALGPPSESSDSDDPAFVALRFSLLFSDKVLVEKVGLGLLTDEQLFYNKYYWFLRFVRLSTARNGYDAGLEQQVFKLLESPHCTVDWGIVEGITSKVERELM